VIDNALQRLAELTVKVGANVQPGQVVAVHCEPGKEPLVRAIAEQAYLAGAKFVDVSWFDPWIKRARVQHAADDTLDYVPSWYGERALALGDVNAARVALSGPTAPGLMSDLDPVRSGRDRLPAVKENMQVVNARTVNWTVVPCPTAAWAELVHPDLEPDAALEKLWEQIVRVCRLDEDDPVEAWRQRREELVTASEALSARHFDSLHYEAPGTDFTVGLLPSARWIAAKMETAFGVEHMANIPTEEVFTSPDPARADGHVRSTKPLVLLDGTVVRDLAVEFRDGRIVSVTASEGEEVMRTIIERDEGSARLGELALVDRKGRIGELDTVFYDTLLDENAASHIAIGTGFPFLVSDDDVARVNQSEIHIDFMIGSPEMKVTGITHDGDRVPLLVDGDWQI
jgi:aminopeptidase